MNGLGCEKDLKKFDFWVQKTVDKQRKDKYIKRYSMKKIANDYVLMLLLMTPFITAGAYAAYRLALEVWCIVYGLIY